VAGLPQDSSVQWTHLKPSTICDKMQQAGHTISGYIAKKLLVSQGLTLRSMLKNDDLKVVENRNEQFEKISRLRQYFTRNSLPILSIDTKKKELLGNFKRPGQVYCSEFLSTYDHDFLSFSHGQLVPHGIYDVVDNKGYLTLGTSKETAAFVCDNIAYFWVQQLQYKYPNADTILLLCDGGGANSCLHYIFKYRLAQLSKTLDMNILVAHYPAYCSKYNPIEHRLFSQISHTWSGLPLYNIEFVKELTQMTTTRTGLQVYVNINRKTYETKVDVPQSFKDNLEQFCTFDDKIPKWNYIVKVP
jgi:Rhodopirellula transposase DDE domain